MAKKRKKTAPARPVEKKTSRPDIKIGWGWILLGLSVLVLVLFINTLMKGHLIHGSDQLISGYMFKSFAKESIAATGEFPLWNPYIFGGLPYVDALHGDVFYITALLRMVFSVSTVMALVFVLQIIVAGIFTYGFLRTLKVRNLAAIIGALAYMFTGAIVSFVDAGHDGKVIVASLLPAGLFFIQKAFDVETKRKIAHFALLALVIGLALLSPHVQMTYYMLMLMAFYIIFKFFVLGVKEKRWGFAGKSLGLSFASLAVGFGISAIQFLPSWSYLPFSPRGAGGRGWLWNTSYSMPRMELMDLVNPRFSGTMDSYWGSNPLKQHAEYFGIIILVLLVVGLIIAWRRRETKFFAGFGLFGLLMALGGNTIFYVIPYNILPLLNRFRAPAMIFYTVSFSAVVVAMLGLQAFLDNTGTGEKKKKRRLKPRKTAGIAAGVAGGVLLILALWSSLAPGGFARGLVGSIQRSAKKQTLADFIDPDSRAEMSRGDITRHLASSPLGDNSDRMAAEFGRQMVSLGINNPNAGQQEMNNIMGQVLAGQGYNQFNPPGELELMYMSRVGYKSLTLGKNMNRISGGFWLALLFAAAAGLIIFFWGRMPRYRILWAALLAAAVFTDLWLVDSKFVGIVRDSAGNPVSAEELYAPDQIVSFLKQDTDVYRVYHLQPMGRPIYRNDDYLMLHGIQEVGGYHGNQLGRYQEFIGTPQTIMFRNPSNLRHQQFLTMLDVRYIIGLTPPDTTEMERYSPADQEKVRAFFSDMAFVMDSTVSPYRPVYSNPRYAIYRNMSPCSRAWLCTEVEVISEDSRILQRLKEPGFDPRRTVVLEEKPEGWQASADTLPAGTVRITSYEPNSIEISADLEKPSVLVLSENWYPYYRAWVDGEERKVYRADYTLRAVPLEAGNHQVVFRFSSPYMKAGTWITIVSLALVGLAIALSIILVKRRKKKSKS
ncbi:YfhO family protein [candidate division WOR-3 bacterium]|uniref:YfhO family protein n=1 Tax=candidate division WOR-3 bacterium TaxID=2052148 RepID=A0A9D5K7G4_UNCW3|nr:YfhO family protein [candidate division WOR-3 bacterium]MBD3363667.1 YfhO family protein [candidate division WOR-3 bacterium]